MERDEPREHAGLFNSLFDSEGDDSYKAQIRTEHGVWRHQSRDLPASKLGLASDL